MSTTLHKSPKTANRLKRAMHPAEERESTRASRRVRPRLRRNGPSLSESLVLLATTYGVVAFISFVMSNVTGNAMLESARRDRLAAVNRAGDARSEVARLRREVDKATSLEPVERWATARGMYLSVVGRPESPPEITVAGGWQPASEVRLGGQ